MVAPLGKIRSGLVPPGDPEPGLGAQAGLIEADKRGKWTWWRIVPERLAAVRQALGGT